MPFTLTMPKMSPTMEEGTIAKWHKQVGEFVEADELLFEVATDKATVEYNALDSGWLRQIIVPDGHEAIVNQPVAIFTEEKDESIDDYSPEGAAPKETAKTDLRNEELPSIAESAQTVAQEEVIDEGGSERIKASPLARKLAKQQGLNLSAIKGTGPRGRIVSRDLSGASPLLKHPSPKELVGIFTEETLSPIRKVISKRLQEAKSTIPHFYVSMKIDADPLIAAREQLKAHNVKLTYNDFVVKATALALKSHPEVNSGFNAAANSLIRFKTIDISIAVSVHDGLITPIVRGANDKTIHDISNEIKHLAARAKEGKLEAKEYQGGSFTISNLGMYGVADFIAIINPPQAAILAVSGINQVPVVRNGQVVPGNEMMLTLSGDHRVIDGVAGAEFLRSLKKYLEDPAILL